ncbi:hypothetical protein BN136_2006 [Cronobacter universalis NCTC 9529]|nr:hypothetical protein BN136_2006 [Cronobacter universalis NCTC 9529]
MIVFNCLKKACFYAGNCDSSAIKDENVWNWVIKIVMVNIVCFNVSAKKEAYYAALTHA